MNTQPRILGLALLLLAVASPAIATRDYHGDWRVIRIVTAPWAASSAQLGPAGITVGDTLTLSAGAIDGPDGLACTASRMAQVDVDEANLFAGQLSEPWHQARTLGLREGHTTTLRIDCGDVIREFHRADANTLLFAFEHRILTLGRSPGTQASADSPAGRVQRLLETHYAGSMAFSSTHWADLEDFLTAELRSEISAWSAAPWPDDEPPPINGDPLTESQEYPTRFHVVAEWIQDDRAPVEVDFADAYRHKRLIYTMWLEEGVWRLRDVHGESGESFVDALLLRPDEGQP